MGLPPEILLYSGHNILHSGRINLLLQNIHILHIDIGYRLRVSDKAGLSKLNFILLKPAYFLFNLLSIDLLKTS